MATGYLQNKQKLRGIRRMLFAVAAINAFCAIVMGIVSSFIESSLPIYIQSLVVGFLAYLVPILLYSHANEITVSVAKERFSLNPVKALPLIIAAVSGVCFQFVMVIINLPMNFILGTSEGYMPTSVYELIAMIIIIGVMPAFFEEFLFRGIVYGSMAEINTKAAAVFSAVMFAILHADIYGFFGYLVMGLVLAFVLRRTGSLWAAMVFHFTNNVTAIMLGFFNDELLYSPVATITMFVAGVIGFIAAVIALRKLYKPQKGVSLIKTSQLLGQSFINLPILLCVVVIALSMFVLRNI